jgi:magnesium-transporting ATPase (P-type)
MFILSGCNVVEGEALFLVTAVGKNSEWGKVMMEVSTDRPDTPLQVKTYSNIWIHPCPA